MGNIMGFIKLQGAVAFRPSSAIFKLADIAGMEKKSTIGGTSRLSRG